MVENPGWPGSVEEARALGAKYYFTGKPCSRGHIAVRSTNKRECWECVKKRYRDYYAANREACLARNSAYQAAHEAECRERQRRYRKVCKPDRAYHERHKEARNADMARRNSLRRALVKGGEVLLSPAEKVEVDGLYQFTQVMGITREYHVDHRISLSNGGSHHPTNLQVLSAAENRAKGNKDLEWLLS